MYLRWHKIARHMVGPYEQYDPSKVGTEGALPDLPTSYPGEEDRYGYLEGETREDKDISHAREKEAKEKKAV